MTPILQIRGVSKHFGGFTALDGVSIEVGQGERFGLIRFGSRTDCYMPRGTTVHVKPGDRVIGGVTVLGTLP